MKLIRVNYGKKDTPEEMREYRINRVGPVGTLKEFKENFPGMEFEIEDNISSSLTEEERLCQQAREEEWQEDLRQDKIYEEMIDGQEFIRGDEE